jgi:hypothetical protein
MPDPLEPAVRRRSFLSRLGAAAAAVGSAFAVGGEARAAEPSRTPQGGWSPARHPQDDWLDELPGKHRFFFDAITPNGTGEAIAFATNFYTASRTGYDLGDEDNAVVICLRHWATPFAFTDSVWARHGAAMAERIRFTDPLTNAAPVVNAYMTTGYGPRLPNRGTTLEAMARRGTHFAICDMATRVFAGIAASRAGLTTDAVYAEMRANAIPNAHFMSAGIVAVNRAHERRYAIQYIG